MDEQEPKPGWQLYWFLDVSTSDNCMVVLATDLESAWNTLLALEQKRVSQIDLEEWRDNLVDFIEDMAGPEGALTLEILKDFYNLHGITSLEQVSGLVADIRGNNCSYYVKGKIETT